MSVLSDVEIRKLSLAPMYEKKPLLFPFSEGVQGGGVISFGVTSAGYDLRLGDKVLMFKNTYNGQVDPKAVKTDPAYMKKMFDVLDDLKPGERIWIPPQGYILGYSMEYIRMPRWIKGTCVGKSTLARCGVHVNTTPLEPDWEGYLTLEIANHTPCPVCIFAGEGVAQLEFHTIFGEVEKSYADKGASGGKYQRQGMEPVPARVVE